MPGRMKYVTLWSIFDPSPDIPPFGRRTSDVITAPQRNAAKAAPLRVSAILDSFLIILAFSRER